MERTRKQPIQKDNLRVRTCGQAAVGAERQERSAQRAAWALLRDRAAPGVDAGGGYVFAVQS
jgi:hypothetical protein